MSQKVKTKIKVPLPVNNEHKEIFKNFLHL